jgi:hypothetical protein
MAENEDTRDTTKHCARCGVELSTKELGSGLLGCCFACARNEGDRAIRIDRQERE